jgi:hypothetical protein
MTSDYEALMASIDATIFQFDIPGEGPAMNDSQSSRLTARSTYLETHLRNFLQRRKLRERERELKRIREERKPTLEEPVKRPQPKAPVKKVLPQEAARHSEQRRFYETHGSMRMEPASDDLAQEVMRLIAARGMKEKDAMVAMTKVLGMLARRMES